MFWKMNVYWFWFCISSISGYLRKFQHTLCVIVNLIWPCISHYGFVTPIMGLYINFYLLHSICYCTFHLAMYIQSWLFTSHHGLVHHIMYISSRSCTSFLTLYIPSFHLTFDIPSNLVHTFWLCKSHLTFYIPSRPCTSFLTFYIPSKLVHPFWACTSHLTLNIPSEMYISYDLTYLWINFNYFYKFLIIFIWSSPTITMFLKTKSARLLLDCTSAV